MRRLIVLLPLLVACKSERPAPTDLAPESQAPSPDDVEAQDAVAVLRTYWPAAQTIEEAGASVDKCLDETPGFAATRECLAKARETMLAARAKRVPAATATGACGREIEAAHRKHGDERLAEVTKTLEWMDKHQGSLSRLMAGRSVWKACDLPGAPCDDRPIPGEGFHVINQVRCTERLFGCPKGPDPCIYKTAGALGMVKGWPATGVTVKSTGKIIQ